MTDAQSFRKTALSELTNEIGVYALCDLDERPIYVGQSTDGIRARVQRHLTSARSDVIANRQIDVWEIGFVWAWPVADLSEVNALEAAVFSKYDAELPLMNGKAIQAASREDSPPPRQRLQVISDEERAVRLHPSQRLPRQIQQYNLLVDYILTVKDAKHLKRSLDAHFQRLVRYHSRFL
ncbi:MAG: GIY-YIG nuclease family protein [Aestuariivita sp.]|uniref:GIY-YIG nuclease family protein n=1 Tax=Aestuariivita sp. TaxID=1872407 RepID=UPI003BB0BF14